MEMKTLTSTLVLSLMLAGPAVIAMEPEEITGEIKNLPLTQELPLVQESNLDMSDEAWLTRSRIDSADLGLIREIVKASRPNATEEQRALGAQATFLLEQNTDANKKQKTEVSVTSPSLTVEDKENVSLFRKIFGGWFQQDESPVEVTTSDTPVSSSPVAVKSDEANGLATTENSAPLQTQSEETTDSSSLQVEQPAQEVIKPSLFSYFTSWWNTTKSTSDPLAENNLGAVVTNSNNVEVATTANNEGSNKAETSGLEETQQ